MSGNSFGRHFIIHTFGESHGAALGAIVDGCPAGLDFDLSFLQSELDRRRPGTNQSVSSRQEPDQVEVLSGVFQGKTLGTPIALIVRNQDQRSADYDQIQNQPRPGHADDIWRQKYGHVDHRGGGRSSGRETVSRVLGGAVAKMVLQKIYPNLKFETRIIQMGPFQNPSETQIAEALEKAKAQGESFGAQIELRIQNPPPSLGQPVFHKLKSDLAGAMMSVGATTAIEFGAGTAAGFAKGTEFHRSNQAVYGGLRGGISTGEDIVMKITMKPTSSILDVAKQGRHDPCIGLRARPVFEAMAALVLVDHHLGLNQDQFR
ncbi:MAG: chorismate synthase [Oligoflexia bacterium]|nr:MAG: chorismate synthase [Oligoflexia bacterium]